jgi:hypothetical protein
VHVADIGECQGVALVCRQTEQAEGLVKILRNAGAFEIEDPEIVLRPGIALIGRLAIPRRRHRRIGLHAAAEFVDDADRVLGIGVARFGRPSVPE